MSPKGEAAVGVEKSGQGTATEQSAAAGPAAVREEETGAAEGGLDCR